MMAKMKKTRTKGVWQRRDHFYMRKREGSAVRWVSLGDNYEKARTKHREHLNGAPVIRRTTVERAVEEWLTVKVPTRRNEKGVRQARVRAETYLLPMFRGTLLTSITKDSIRLYRKKLEGQKLKPLTVTHVLSDLRAFLRWCVDSEKLVKNPWPSDVLPRVQETPPRGFTEEEAAKLMALPDPGGFVIRFLIGSGLRWGEAVRAIGKRRDAKDTVYIEDGAVVVSKTKSGKVRRVPLPSGLLAEIRTRIGPLVPFPEGNPGGFARAIRRASGIEDFHVHRCRHTFAYRWLADQGSLATLQELLGHADISTTMRYAKVDQDLVEREARRVFKEREGA
jgi:integrase/recombinase XerC/integrase/recombinase XerD